MRAAIIVLGLAISVMGCNTAPNDSPTVKGQKMSADVSQDENRPYKERVDAAKRKLREDMDKVGLARVADDLEKLMQVSIRLKAKVASEGELKPGSTKLGGTPDLPENTAWPECNGVPMALLAQLRLQDVAAYDHDGRLPQSGMLYFFYETKEQKWGFDPNDRGHWKVIYYDGDPAQLRPANPPENLPQESRFRACKLAYSNEITLPSWDSRDTERLKLSEKDGNRYVELLDAICNEGKTNHRILGHPDQIQGEMKLKCQLVSHGLYTGDSSGYDDSRRPALEKGADDWQLLLQIDSDEDNTGAMWGDAGRVYFWIRQQDLQKRDFSNVWLVLQCY